MQKTCYLLAIILLGVLIQSSTQSKETSQALVEYKQIVEENRSYRTYGAESGLKGNSYYQFTDGYGYRWYSSSDDGYKVFRFDGVRYIDEISGDQVAARDTMLSVLIQTQTTRLVYAGGRRNLYLWKGYYWKKYMFPEQDKILRLLGYDDDIYCLGERGLGFFNQGIWTYRRFKDKISEAEAEQASIGKDGTVYCLALTNQANVVAKSGQNSSRLMPVLTDSSVVYLKQFMPGRTNLLLIASAKTLLSNYSPDTFKIPQIHYDYTRETLWAFIANTDLLYKYDIRRKRLQKIPLEPGTGIQNITATGKNENWLITRNASFVQAIELTPDYPQKKGRQYRSGVMAFSPIILDFLNLNGQLIPLSAQYQAVYSNKYSLIRLLEPDPASGYLNVRELRNPYPDNVCRQFYNFGNLLFLDLQHDKFEDVSRVMILKYPFHSFTQRDILIDSATYRLTYNRQMDSILNQRNGAVSLIPLEIICEQFFQTPSHQQQQNYINTYKVKDYKIVSYQGFGADTDLLSIFKLKTGRMQQLEIVKNADIVGTDEDAELIYLRTHGLKTKSTTDELYVYDLKTGTLKLVDNPGINTAFYSFSGGYHSFDGNKLKTAYWRKNAFSVSESDETHPLNAFRNNFMRVIGAERISNWQGKDKGASLIGKVLEMVGYKVLGNKWMGSSYKQLPIAHNELLAPDLLDVNKYKVSDLSNTVQIKRQDNRTLIVPTHIYNLKDDEMYPKPLWIRFYQQDNKQYFVGHLEKLSRAKYRYRVSQFSDGNLILKPDDFMLNLSNEFIPVISAYLADGIRLFYDAKTLYYHQNDSWQALNLKQFELYGKFGNVTVMKNVLWLCFEKALLRFDPKTRVSYAYTSREGIPDGMEEVFVASGKLMIKTRDSILAFNQYKNKLVLDIPFIIVSDSLRISTKTKIVLSYRHRRLEIPVSILGPLYPELCQISYRLRGFNDDWVVKDYLGKIRYDKLPYGSYIFEVRATAANGAETPVQSFPIRIKPPWYYAWYAFVSYALALLALVFLIYRWRLYRYKEANRELELQVAERTHELQEWQLRMTQSIDYALLIQKSILPQEEQLQRLLKKHFIIWHPRDVVGGDFYWLHELPDGDSILFAVIDCTGHGVPGALVSMTVNAALNHIVKDHGVNTPSDILERLHQDIGLTLHQESEKTQQDGLDISLVKINFTEQTLSFSGAALDLIFYNSNHELQVLKGSRYSIGGLKHRKNLVFESQEVSYSTGSNIYLYTDGILDQPNDIAVRTRRLGPEQLQKIISEMGDKPFPEQKRLLEAILQQMLLLDNQRDDITIVGLQL